MKLLLTAAAVAGLALTASVPAQARDGCGNGFHRGPAGRCRPNRGYARPGGALIVGNFYNGRGYWDGRRYYQQRYRYRNGWRYR